MLLQQARARFGLEAMRGVGLDHVVEIRPVDPNPSTTPTRSTTATPSTTQPVRGALLGGDLHLRLRRAPAAGSRSPTSARAPARRPDSDFTTHRRPVVATLDTGCGEHPWLDDVVRHDVRLDGLPIGYIDAQTDPEQ